MRLEMTCRDGVPLLPGYLEGGLGVRTRKAVERHVSGCRLCRGFVRSYLATPRIVRRATAAPMPRRVLRALRRRLRPEVRGSRARGGRKVR
jgi:hypothetical protein